MGAAHIYIRRLFRSSFTVIKPNFCVDSWQWMKHGFTTLLLSQIGNEQNGNHPMNQTSAGKAMALVFRDAPGILFIDYLPKGKTINSEYFNALLDRLADVITVSQINGSSQISKRYSRETDSRVKK